MSQTKIGDTVSIHFTCKLEDGTIFDTSIGKEPLRFTIGQGQIMECLEQAVIGMTQGEIKTTIIGHERAFGPHLKDKVHVISREIFPSNLQPMVGLKFEITQNDGTTNTVYITDVSESDVTLDTNYLLAGKDLFFDIELIEIVPHQIDHSNEFYKKGVELHNSAKIDEAISYYQKAIDQNPNFASAYYNLGVAFQEKDLLDRAILYYEIAIGKNQKFIDAHYNLGVAFKEKGQFDEALICFQRVLQLEPNHIGAHYNIGNVLVAKGHFKEAMQFYKKSIEIDPENADAHWNIALLNLMSANFEEGWKGYEWRWKLKGVRTEHNLPQPLWDGKDLNGQTILLYTEQGFGDTLQFIRYVPMVKQLGGRVIVKCQKELASLLKNIEEIERVITNGEGFSEWNVQYPLLSLPLLFNTTLQNIPSVVPYISADPKLIKKWGDKITSNESRMKIGLVWSGDPRLKNDRSRSFTLGLLSSLAYFNDITYYSLQKGEASEQSKTASKDMQIVDYTEEINDFADTAAFIQNLDLVISADTAVAHLAGALGKQVWTLLPSVPDWRWMLNREDSPWYPTMRLFRQPAPGDWESVIQLVIKALDEFLLK
ncbi:MAG: tetratricopeptide repeat protein [Thermodesulfovibrionales bacterium]|nr:tetratricopeptide repeat protein [Thermodesulfovibrionales bacterium]